MVLPSRQNSRVKELNEWDRGGGAYMGVRPHCLGSVWQCLETFLDVVAGRGAYWPLAGRNQAWCRASYRKQRTNPTTSGCLKLWTAPNPTDTLLFPLCDAYDKVSFINSAPKRLATTANRVILTICCNARRECGLSPKYLIVLYSPFFLMIIWEDITPAWGDEGEWWRRCHVGFSWWPSDNSSQGGSSASRPWQVKPQIWGGHPKGPKEARELEL